MGGNSTSGDNDTLLQSLEWRITAGILYALLFLVGTAGNLLVVYIFGWQKRGKRKTSELLLLSLGICDLMTSFILAPSMAFVALYAGQNLVLWYRLACQAIPLILTVFITITQIILFLICYDRYRAIVTPLKQSVGAGSIRIGVVTGIILGIVLSIPMLMQADNEQLKQGVCFDYTEKGYLIISQGALLVTRDVVSFAMMAYFIRKMLNALKHSASFRRSVSSKFSAKHSFEFRRAKKILYAVLIMFVVLIWPTDICFLSIFVYYNGDAFKMETMELLVVSTALFMLLQTVDSTVNVFIYSAVHPDFKKVLKRVKDALCSKFRNYEESDSAQGTINLSFSQPKKE